MRKIKRIIIHCSASEYGDAALIDGWHKGRGWRGIGYHFVILNGRRRTQVGFDHDADGLIEVGRPLEEVGAHCKGENADSIGICMIGIHHFTLAQFESLTSLICGAHPEHIPPEIASAIDVEAIHGHREFNLGKSCPNFEVVDFLDLVSIMG